MAGGPQHAGTVGGGADIPPPHPTGRLTRAAGAVGLAAAFVAWVAGHPGRAAPAAVVAPALAGLACLVAAVTLRWPRLIAPAITLLGLGFLVTRFSQPIDGGAVWYGTVLLVVAELAFWSLELRFTAGRPPGDSRRRGLFIIGVAAASAVLSGAALLVGASSPGGVAWEATSALATVAVLGVVVSLAHRASSAWRGSPSGAGAARLACSRPRPRDRYPHRRG